jgi:hypothetical protein
MVTDLFIYEVRLELAIETGVRYSRHPPYLYLMSFGHSHSLSLELVSHPLWIILSMYI